MAKSAELQSDLNPIVWDIMFFGFRMAARMLKELGVLDTLAKKAAASKNEVDDKGVKIVQSILEIMAS